jgi:hypothetical protein
MRYGKYKKNQKKYVLLKDPDRGKCDEDNLETLHGKP